MRAPLVRARFVRFNRIMKLRFPMLVSREHKERESLPFGGQLPPGWLSEPGALAPQRRMTCAVCGSPAKGSPPGPHLQWYCSVHAGLAPHCENRWTRFGARLRRLLWWLRLKIVLGRLRARNSTAH
jgi:hypothetical protein